MIDLVHIPAECIPPWIENSIPYGHRSVINWRISKYGSLTVYLATVIDLRNEAHFVVAVYDEKRGTCSYAIPSEDMSDEVLMKTVSSIACLLLMYPIFNDIRTSYSLLDRFLRDVCRGNL